MVLTVTRTGARRARLERSTATSISTEPRFARGLIVAFLIMVPVWLAVGLVLLLLLG